MTFSACACMGEMYGEPHCYCTMKRLGLPLNTEAREAERIRSEAQWAEFCRRNRKAAPTPERTDQ